MSFSGQRQSSYKGRLCTICQAEKGNQIESSSFIGDDEEKEENEIRFDLKTAMVLIGGQSLIAFLALIFAYLMQSPMLGLGKGFVVNNIGTWKDGVLATLPLGFIAVMLDGVEESVPALQKVTKATQRNVLTLMGAQFLPLTGFLVAMALGIIAGVGEEWLFRGVIQTGMIDLFQHQTNDTGAATVAAATAVVMTSVIFGALHAVTPLYAILATFASIFFGSLYIWSDNLAIPMICHAVYDIGSLYYAHWTVAKDLTPSQRKDLLQLPL